MKTKILLSFICLFSVLSLSASAQDSEPSLVSYQAEVQAGVAISADSYSFTRLQLETIQGVRVGEYFSTGVGTGVNAIVSNEMDGGSNAILWMPVYANFKGYLPVSSKVKLFASIDLGTMFQMRKSFDCMGFVYTPALGVSFGLKNGNAINLSVGYESMCDGDSYSADENPLVYNTVSLKFAYRF
ncbi:MAG: hypothetical protein R3Y49_02380 [Rikenellaceae bacterium]